MTPLAKRDVGSGVALAAFGTFFAVYAATQLRLGSFQAIGSGMFPFLTGIILVVMGLAILAKALSSRHEQAAETAGEAVEKPEWLSLAVVIAAIAAFALIIKPFGMVPALFALTLISSVASEKLTLRVALALATGLSITAWVVFILALGLPLRTIDWPF
jgi:uncharacterized membrane protein